MKTKNFLTTAIFIGAVSSYSPWTLAATDDGGQWTAGDEQQASEMSESSFDSVDHFNETLDVRPGPGRGPGRGPGHEPGRGPGYGPGRGPGRGPWPGYGHFRGGGYPWPYWRHPYFVRPLFPWVWATLSLVSCTAQDSRGYLYEVTEGGYYGWEYQWRINEIEDAALNRCYYESGDPSCRLVTCTPGY